jgi:hypothetical protein
MSQDADDFHCSVLAGYASVLQTVVVFTLPALA